MFLKKSITKIIKIAIFLTISFNLVQCGLYRPTDARKIPTNAKERMAKNIEEGRSIKFSKIGKGKSGTFSFASSNEMWRATIEILDFVPLTSADYGGGIVITDWYNGSDNENESVKIMVQFLSNEVRADGLKVIVYDKLCKIENLNSCKTSINQTSLSEDIKLEILKKASKYKAAKTKEKVDEYRKEFPIQNKKIRKN